MNQYYKTYFNENFFDTIDSEEKAYWLGFIAADGCIIDSNKRIQLALEAKDKEHLFKYSRSLLSERTPSYSERTDKKKRLHKRWYLFLSSKKMYNDLLDKGITSRKSLTLLSPKNVPKNLIRHWIRGYFDGDGCIYYNSKRSDTRPHISIRGTKEVLEFIKRETNLPYTIKFHKTFVLSFAKLEFTKKFYNYLYDNANFFLLRKYFLFHQSFYDRPSRLEYYSNIVKEVAKRGTCLRLKVGCILTDENNRIVATGYNSSISGSPHCSEIGCLIVNDHCIRCPHAEISAINSLSIHYKYLICYLTHSPCLNCFKALVSAGVKHIYFIEDYIDIQRDLLNRELKIPLTKIELLERKDG